MSLVKSKLRSIMSQDRLESLMFCSVGKEILLSLDDNLISKFASIADRRIILSYNDKLRIHYT